MIGLTFQNCLICNTFFPTCQVRVVKFYVSCPPPPSFPSFLPSSLGRTSTASSRSQWALPDLHCQLLIAVGLAGPHLPALDRSGRPRRTSTANSRSQRVWPDINRRESERSGPRWTSTGEIRRTVGLAKPQPARVCGRRRTSTE